MMKEITTFEAKCSKCNETFIHPSLGDFSYGENIFYTIDGKHQVVVSAFADFPKKIEPLITSKDPSAFWKALALLADTVDSKQLAPEMRCSHCASTELSYWEGERVGSVNLPEISYFKSNCLNEKEIKNILSKAGISA